MIALLWNYYSEFITFLYGFFPHFFFSLSHANALPPITLPPLLFARFCCFFLLFPLSLSSSFFCLMLGRIDLLMVRGIKLGPFATRYDGIFYKQTRIKWKKQKKRTTVCTHSKFCKAYVSVELAVFAWMLNGQTSIQNLQWWNRRKMEKQGNATAREYKAKRRSIRERERESNMNHFIHDKRPLLPKKR